MRSTGSCFKLKVRKNTVITSRKIIRYVKLLNIHLKDDFGMTQDKIFMELLIGLFEKWSLILLIEIDALKSTVSII